jgi:glyoxylase-like metal-dependent hydrolase (beta-lactamase superfamily II)
VRRRSPALLPELPAIAKPHHLFRCRLEAPQLTLQSGLLLNRQEIHRPSPASTLIDLIRRVTRLKIEHHRPHQFCVARTVAHYEPYHGRRTGSNPVGGISTLSRAYSHRVPGLPDANGWTVALLKAGILPIEATDLAPEGVLSSPVSTVVNVVLLRGHGRTILVDAGSGPFVAIWPGATDELAARLDAEDATPDLIVITHFDFDHAGGLVVADGSDGLAPAFAGVPVIGPAAAVAEARRVADESPASRVISALDRAGLMEGYEDGDEPAPGLRLRAAPGHRAGHSIVEIGDSLVHAVDIVHHPLQVEHPEWDRTWDAEPEVALATRLSIMTELAERGSTVVTSHFASPGRIERAGDGLRWAAFP